MVEQPVQARGIEALHCLAQLRLPADGGIGCKRVMHVRLITRQDTADLADRHTAFEPPEDAPDIVDVRQRIQAVATVGACWLDQPIAPLPGTQGHGIDPGEPGNFTYREQVLILPACFDLRCKSLIVHLH
ncbi:hypothetical protein D3C81_1600220 [compost metagenome]